ncbi:MAG: hypothetical protein DRI61_14725, partial [Chloroflexi bacterium]
MTQKSLIPKPVGKAHRGRSRPRTPYEDKETPRRAVIYLRVSSEEQEKGHSLEAQERECREFLRREKPSWTIVDVCQDVHSGKTDRRPGFQKMMNMIYEGKADAIVAHHLDRFSRNLHDILTYFKTLEEMNVVMVFAKDRFDFSTEEGRLQFHVLAVFADWYLQNLARETRKGKLARVLKGLPNNRLPFGYIKGPDGIAKIVPEEAEVIRQAFELYATGNYTDAQIADFLNKAGFRTRRGRLWSKDTVRDLLQNEFYIGLVKYYKELYPGKHEPIISKELFEKVQQVRQTHYRKPKVYSTTVRPYLLSGIACCAQCGRTLRAQGGKRYSYYREMSRARGFDDCPHAGKSIQVKVAEEQLGRIMMAFSLPPDWQEEIRQVLEQEDRRKAILGERKRLQEKLRRLGRLYADGAIDDLEYQTERDEIKRRLEELVVPEPSGTVEAGFQLETLGDVWPYATPWEKKEICRLMLK